MKKTGKAKKPAARTARPSGFSKHKPSGMRKTLLGAFLVGAVLGILETEYPWHGMRVLTNAGLVMGYGLCVAMLTAIVWALTGVRQRAAALIWRKRA
jgi:hypothetical protein